MPLTASPSQCQRFCRDHSGCAFFTYDAGTGECFLKGSEDFTAQAQDGAVSGPRDCFEGGERELPSANGENTVPPRQQLLQQQQKQ